MAGMGCGGPDTAVPASAQGSNTARPIKPSSYEAAELMPADLDLVVRIDLARMKASLGPEAAAHLSARAFQEEPGAAKGDAFLMQAIEQAELVWVGLRLADLEAGDRVIAVEAKGGETPDRSLSYRRLPSQLEGLDLWERSESVSRSETERVLRINPRLTLFVSPVEVDSVMRVLGEGPDARRGEPQAVGLISLDFRPSRFSASLKKKFPSITSLLEGVTRVRAHVLPVREGLRLNAVIDAKNKASATRIFRFIAAFRDNVSSDKSVELFRGLELEPLESTLSIRWTLPLSVVAGWLSRAPAEPLPSDNP